MFKIIPAEKEDAGRLTEIQIEAFEKDRVTCGVGPPGLDSVDTQESNIEEYNYYKIVSDTTIIGGFFYQIIKKIKHLN
ncbi:MAG: hypothetical protein JEY99_15630 [Spirochaetales bacterium]|nr:hypothetical protein [Spirochaetales bacterium]